VSRFLVAWHTTTAIAFLATASAQAQELPSGDQFRSAIVTCVGTDVTKKPIAELASSDYDSQRPSGANDFRALIPFLSRFPDADRVKAYEIYVQCVTRIIPTRDSGAPRAFPQIVHTPKSKGVVVQRLLYFCAASNNDGCSDTTILCVKPEPGNVFAVDDKASFADDQNIHLREVPGHDAKAWGTEKSSTKICVRANASVDNAGRNSRVNAKLTVREKIVSADAPIPSAEFPESAGPFSNLQ
jgi:hypothetical protein